MCSLTLLDWDSNFFNQKIGKLVWGNNTSTNQLIEHLNIAKKENYDLIYLFSEVGNKIDNSILSTFNGKLVDTKITFQKAIKPKEPTPNTNIKSYSAPTINEELRSLAHLSGNFSRFKIDANFSQQDFINLYNEWLKNSVNRKIADEVFVYEENNTIVGFVTVLITKKIGNIGLIAVNPKVQGKKIGSHLINHVESYLLAKNISKLNVPTQKENSLACDFYLKNNFKIFSTQLIYHFSLE